MLYGIYPSKKTDSIGSSVNPINYSALSPTGLQYISNLINLLILHIRLPIHINLDLGLFMDIEVWKIQTLKIWKMYQKILMKMIVWLFRFLTWLNIPGLCFSNCTWVETRYIQLYVSNSEIPILNFGFGYLIYIALGMTNV